MLALPFLESMVAGADAAAQTAATPKTRLALHLRAARRDDGQVDAGGGRHGFAFTEILKPLEPFRDHVNVVSGLAHPYVAGAGGADVSAGANHTRAAAVFLTGAIPESGAQAHLGVSVDQVAAQHIGQDTPLPSLELSIEEACSRARRRSAAPTAIRSRGSRRPLPLPMENNPRLVFEKLFGDGAPTPSGARGGRIAQPARFGDRAGVVAAEGSAGRAIAGG